jgi:pimeloyl-ACP methyl ester carboxylesterase
MASPGAKMRRALKFSAAGAAALAFLLPATSATAACTAPAAKNPTAAATLPAPSGLAFYNPPDPLPPGKPGDLIWYRPAKSPVAGANAWQILYRSTGARGNAIAVSGEVIVPSSSYNGTRPVAAYASGTQGWAPQCAPSREMDAGDFDEQFAVDGLVAKGWATVVTDYPGQGTPGPELYTVGIAEGHAVLDALRAAERLPGTGLSASAQTVIEGYSQGGGAAGWAAQLHKSYAPDLNLKGVALGGTPANLQAVANNINGTAFFAFLAGSAIGFGAAYPSLSLSSYLNAAGKAAFSQLQTQCQAAGLLSQALKSIQDYTVGGVNPMTYPSFEKVLDANDLGAIKPDVPVMQVHGLADEVIPYSIEVTLHKQWCAMGVKSELVTFPTEHVTTGIDDQAAVLPWLSGRIAGQPAPSNC